MHCLTLIFLYDFARQDIAANKCNFSQVIRCDLRVGSEARKGTSDLYEFGLTRKMRNYAAARISLNYRATK
jgi:hypothetical protein